MMGFRYTFINIDIGFIKYISKGCEIGVHIFYVTIVRHINLCTIYKQVKKRNLNFNASCQS